MLVSMFDKFCKNFTVKSKIFTIFLVILMIGMAAVVVIRVNQIQTQTNNLLIERLQGNANMTFGIFETVETYTIWMLELAASEARHGLIYGTDIAQHLSHILSSINFEVDGLNAYENILVFDADHNIVALANPARDVVSLSTFDLPPDDDLRPWISPAFFNPASGKLQIMFSRPIFDESRLIGRVAVIGNTEMLEFFLRDFTQVYNSFVNVVDEYGIVFFSNRPEAYLGLHIDELGIQGPSGELPMNVLVEHHSAQTGIDKVVYITTDPNLGWTIISFFDADAIEGVATTIVISLLPSLSGILIAAALVLLIIHRALKPLQDLTTGANAVAKGNVDVKFHYDKNDEIGQLSKSFMDIVSALHILGDSFKSAEKAMTQDDAKYSLTDARLGGIFDEMLTSTNNIVGHLQQSAAEKMQNAKEEAERRAAAYDEALERIALDREYSAGDLKYIAGQVSLECAHTLNVPMVGIWVLGQAGTKLQCINYYEASTRKHAILDDYDFSHHAEFSTRLEAERVFVLHKIEQADDLMAVFGRNLVSLIEAPIRIGGELAGVVVIGQDSSEQYPEMRQWTTEEQNFVSSLADFMATAIANHQRHILIRRSVDMMNKLPGMVYQCRNDPPNYSFTFVSEGCKLLTGFAPEELINERSSKFYDMMHPDEYQPVIDYATSTLSMGLPMDIAYRIILKDGTEKWIWDAARVIETDADGRPLLIEGFCFDITERRRLEAAEHANRAKSDFLAMISHEIRTPMNVIMGIAQIELQKGKMGYEEAEAFQKIYSSGNTLLGIINDILDMSKIETGKLELNPAEYDLPSLIHDAVQLNVVRIGSRPINFILDPDENLPVTLYGDELRIKQILNNLLSNAIKYTEEGHVKFSIKSFAEGQDTILQFVVEDTGQGMRPEDLEKLFSAYSRFNVKDNRTVEGTGIGLNITDNLVKQMEGKIYVESKFGEGSTFTVTIKQKTVESQAIGHELAEKLRNFSFIMRSKGRLQVIYEPMPYGRVLIVDDVETNLYVAQGLLAPYGVTTETAISGFAALKKIKAGRVYDVIFMDHMMPIMDGIETTQQLREFGYKGTIIALTANALVGNDEMFKSKGFNGFVPKPIDIRRMDAVMTRYVRDMHPQEAAKYKNFVAPQPPYVAAQVDPRMVSAFLRDAKSAAVTIRKTIKNGDIKLFTTTVHAMKSALGNIREQEAAELADALENAGRNNDTAFIDANAASFVTALEGIIALRDRRKTERADDITEDRVFLTEQMQILKTACENYDDTAAYAALNRLEEKPWTPEVSGAIEEIYNTLMLRSDFEKAAEMAAKFY